MHRDYDIRRLSDLYWAARAEIEDGWYRLIEHTVCRWRGHRWGEWEQWTNITGGAHLEFRSCKRCHLTTALRDYG